MAHGTACQQNTFISSMSGEVFVDQQLVQVRCVSYLMQQDNCCVAIYPQIFLASIPTKDSGKGFRKEEEGWSSGLEISWIWRMISPRREGQLWSISIIPEGFSILFTIKMLWAFAGARWDEGEKLAMHAQLVCWQVCILFCWRRCRDLAQVV